MANREAKAMRPTFPPPSSRPNVTSALIAPVWDNRGHHRTATESGFTLIESLVAFGVAVIITATVAAGLMGSLRAETSAVHSAEAEFAAQQVASAMYLGFPDGGPAGWSRDERTVNTKQDSMKITWNVVELRSDSHPGAVARVTFRLSSTRVL